jgi:tetratricopeptide (TPR) repeat protein
MDPIDSETQASVNALRGRATEALRRFDLKNATNLAREALKLDLPPGDQASLQAILATAARRKGSLEEAQSAYDESGQMFAEAGDTTNAANSWLMSAQLLLELGRQEEALPPMARLSEYLKGAGLLDRFGRNEITRARILIRLGRLDEASAVLDRAVAVSPPGDLELKVALDEVRSDLCCLRGKHGEALPYLKSALRTAREGGFPRMERSVKKRIGAVLMHENDARGAYRRFQDVAEMALASGDYVDAAMAHLEMAALALQMDSPEAKQLALASFPVFARTSNQEGLYRSSIIVSRILLNEGSSVKALAAADAALQFAMKAGDPWMVFCAMVAEFQAFFACGEMEGAFAALQLARAQRGETGEAADFAFIDETFAKLRETMGESRGRDLEAQLEAHAASVRYMALLRVLSTVAEVRFQRPEGAKKSQPFPYIPVQALIVAAGLLPPEHVVEEEHAHEDAEAAEGLSDDAALEAYPKPEPEECADPEVEEDKRDEAS